MGPQARIRRTLRRRQRCRHPQPEPRLRASCPIDDQALAVDRDRVSCPPRFPPWPMLSRGRASARREFLCAGGRTDAVRDRVGGDVDVRSCNGEVRVFVLLAPARWRMGRYALLLRGAIGATSRLDTRRSKTGRCARKASRRAATGLAVDRFARNADCSHVACDGAATARPDQRADHPATHAGGRANGARPVPLIVASPAGATSMTTSPARRNPQFTNVQRTRLLSGRLRRPCRPPTTQRCANFVPAPDGDAFPASSRLDTLH
jgi:hypothetical protein